MKRILLSLLLASACSFGATNYADATALRVGPVSNYGALGTSGNKIVSLSSGKQVMLRGMSLFWSDATGIPYYKSEVITWAVQNLGINVFRFAMGIQYYSSDGGTGNALDASYSYIGNPDGDISLLDDMVKAAIANDVYIIVDWHSHRAEYEQAYAVAFFTKVAERYKNVPNVIWEVYNEPVNTGWNTVQSYANAVISGIRQYSQNLAIVGSPSWSQNPDAANSSPVSGTNVAYSFHFYAGTHSVSSYGSHVTSAMGAGHPVFITEWGTTDANGSGSVNTSESSSWTSFMESNHISNCNWSLRQYTSSVDSKTELSAMFNGSTALSTQQALSAATYTTSGSFVKSYLTSHKSTWEDTLTAGARSGSCAFAHQSVPETQSSITGVANSGCSYTSSNEAVATISGGVITINKAGYTVMTGNDGTKSVVTATPMPSQTFNFTSFTCRIDSSCTGMNAGNYSGSSNFEQIINTSTTDQGGTITYSSDNPAIISVQKVACNGSACSSTLKGTSVWVARFISVGTATIHATAPAVTGYRALDTIGYYYYLKKLQRYNGTYLRDTAVTVNSSTFMLLDTARYEKAQVTYAFSPEGYASKDGNYLVAGANDATVTLTATIAETTNYEGRVVTVKVIIGSGIMTVIKNHSVAIAPFAAKMEAGELVLTLDHSGFVNVQIINAAGREIQRSVQNYMTAGEHRIGIADLAPGRYFIRVNQGSINKSFVWSKI
jgi:hypothetical protein